VPMPINVVAVIAFKEVDMIRSFPLEVFSFGRNR
jgi:hypothetical protein